MAAQRALTRLSCQEVNTNIDMDSAHHRNDETDDNVSDLLTSICSTMSGQKNKWNGEKNN